MKYLLFALIGFLIINGCSPALQSSSSGKGSYYEDLSKYRLVYENEPDTGRFETQPTDTALAGRYEPVLDITETLNAKLESTAVNAQNKRRSLFGYAVQVYSGGIHETANYSRGKAMSIEPDMKAVLSYETPNYKVRLGEFYSHFEAHSTYLKIKKHFPNAIIVRRKFSY